MLSCHQRLEVVNGIVLSQGLAFMLFKLADTIDYYIVFWRSDKLMQRKSVKRKAAFLKSFG